MPNITSISFSGNEKLFLLDVASGKKKSWAEQWKLHNALVLFNPAPVT